MSTIGSTIGSSSKLSLLNSYEPLEDDITSPAAFLLPSHHRGSAATARSKIPSRRILLLVAFILFSTSFVFAYTVARSRYSSDRKDLHAANEEVIYLNSSRTPEPSPSIPWLSSPAAASNLGVIPFSSANFSPLLPLRPLAITDSLRPFSPICLDLWLSQGIVCKDLLGKWGEGGEKLEMDVIWTWSNGSQDELMSEWRNQASDESEPSFVQGTFTPVKVYKVAAQFRDHHELQYSMRSVVAALPLASLRTLHLIVGDTPNGSPSERNSSHTHRLAQVPRFLNLQSVVLADFPPAGRSLERDLGELTLRIHPHSEIFKTGAYDDELALGEGVERNMTALYERDEIEATSWRNHVLPSFNSLAIESQVANLEDVSDTALYLNDDFFILKQLAYTDIASPLTGPVFRLQRSLLVDGVDPIESQDNPSGEWKGLGFSAWTLDNRFGKRKRPYVMHQAKSVSMSVLREAQDNFLNEFTATAGSRFRGKGLLEIQMSFLRIHYVIEKHREALLWSFFLGRSDVDQDGNYSAKEAADILAELGYQNSTGSTIISAPRPVRYTLRDLSSNYGLVGLDNPFETALEFTSMDGYAHFVDDDPRITDDWPNFDWNGAHSTSCKIKLEECFGDEFIIPASDFSVEAVSVFRRIAFEQPRCGDCIITQLVKRSGYVGFEAFLPPSEGKINTSHGPLVEGVGLSDNSFLTADFALPPLSDSTITLRQRCLSLIHRYSYTLGSSSSAFVPVQSAASLYGVLEALDQNLPTFLVLNDELGNSLARYITMVDDVMKTWFVKMWGDVPTKFESRTV